MKRTLLVGIFSLTLASSGFAQIGGGVIGGNGFNNRDARSGSPAAQEQAKRLPGSVESKDDGSSTFVSASMLMNVKAQEYVAVFGVALEDKTPAQVGAKMDATLAKFKASLKRLGIAESDIYVDFVQQNRIYEFQPAEPELMKEVLAGFELKKNVSIHFKQRDMIEKLISAAAEQEIYDLVKVDYIVKDLDALQAKLQVQTMDLIKKKAELYENGLKTSALGSPQLITDAPSVYYPVEQYESYQASEGQSIQEPRDNSRTEIRRARRTRTSYFNPLNGKGFDTVINPIVIEPVVQLTTYIKVKFKAAK